MPPYPTHRSSPDSYATPEAIDEIESPDTDEDIAWPLAFLERRPARLRLPVPVGLPANRP